jgi:hypothetical protein
MHLVDLFIYLFEYMMMHELTNPKFVSFVRFHYHRGEVGGGVINLYSHVFSLYFTGLFMV